MNRLREQGNLSLTAAWMLAAAYAKAGQQEAAKGVMAKLSTNVKPYQEMDYSFGSDVRDKAIILETLILLNDRTRGLTMLKDIASVLGNPNTWMSTQSTSWSLKSIGMFAASEQKGELKFTYTYNGDDTEASTQLPMAQVQLPMEGAKAGSLKIESESKGTLFVRLITEGTPPRGLEEEESSNLNLTVSYADTDGNPVDPTQLQQGAEFVASVTVFNPGIKGAYKNMAINQIFPSGWEINNLRLDDAEDKLKGDKPTYQDIRDDRVYTYFDLGIGQRKTFQVLLTASYAGTYYLPAVSCEAMYDHGIYARTKGQTVEVVKQVGE
jgi:alpha-2-macroglobulin